MFGNLGVVPVRGRRGWERSDCLTCNAGVSCNMVSLMCSSWYVSVKQWVIYTYEHGFLYIPRRALCFLVYDVEALWAEGMSCETAVLVNGGGVLRCSLILSSCALHDLPMFASMQFIWGYLKWYITPLSLSLGTLPLGLTSRVLRVFVPLKWTWMPLVLQTFLTFSPVPYL